MMKCSVCGNELPDNTSVCDVCGCELPAQPPAPLRKRGRRRKKPGRWTVFAAIAGAVAIAAVLIWNLPIVQIPLALKNSTQALQPVAEQLLQVVRPLRALTADHSTSLTATFLQLQDLPGEDGVQQWSQFQGATLALSGSMGRQERRLSGDLTLTHGDQTLLEGNFGLDQAMAWLELPALFSDVYGLEVYSQAEALQALEALGLDVSPIQSWNLNYFGVSRPTSPPSQPKPPAPEPPAPEPLSLFELVTSLKMSWSGRKTLTVNGHETVCRGYTVTVPEALLTREPLAGYLSAGTKLLERVYGAATGVGGAVGTAGDLTVELYLKDGYIAALGMTLEMGGKPLYVTAQAGGGEEYVNDLSLNITVPEGASLALSSGGNHTGRAGLYSSKTVCTVTGTVDRSVTADWLYRPEETDHNFLCKLAARANGQAVLDLEGAGQLAWGQDSISLESQGLSLDIGGQNIATLDLRWELGPYTAAQAAPEVQCVNGLDEAGVAQVRADFLMTAKNLVFKLIKTYPMLRDLLLERLLEML